MTAIAASRSSVARDIIMVFKPRIALFIMLSALGGLAATPGELPDLWRIAVLMAAVFLAAAAAGAFNQWAESDLDAQMSRTAGRPFATGQFEAGGAWLLAISGLLAVSVMMAGLATNWWAACYTFLGAFTYGVVYTIWLKRRTWTNIVIGGLAGSFAVLAGAAGVNPDFGPSALVLAVVLFLWTPPHFWSLAMLAREDYAKANVPMLPVIAGDRVCAWVILGHTLTLTALSLVPVYFGFGLVYLAGALIGGGVFCWTSLKLVAAQSRKNALRNFLASLLHLAALMGGLFLDRMIGAIG